MRLIAAATFDGVVAALLPQWLLPHVRLIAAATFDGVAAALRLITAIHCAHT